jgi:very-short-patch-repair endonuclease
MIDVKLEEVRRRLLDLTRKNRLLNYRATGRGTLAIVDEVPGAVYRNLAGEGCTFQFLSRDEAPDEIRDSLPSEERPEHPASGPEPFNDAGQSAPTALPLAPIGANGAALSERHQDLRLQTALAGEALQARLIHLAREANSALQEQGYNILYLTLGMVDWCEPGAQQAISRAPLVFVPVELKRKSVNTRHSLRAFDDDVLTNPCLSELCQSRYQLALPRFDPESDDLEGYFEQVRQSLAGLANWRVTPEIHLGLFSFSKLLMYRDLDPQSWPDAAQLTGHPLVNLLSGLGPEGAENAEGVPDPNTLDATLKAVDTYQVVDADSSQQAAILAAKRGVNLVIDGPPGTGKSQTITNIIAECMAAGRTVLFVSEKAAALEVVKRRLENAGLGDAVLELHSRKASKKAVLLELQRTFERQSVNQPVPLATASELDGTRQELNEYRRELHEPFGPLGLSPFQGIAQAAALAAEPEVACEVPEVLEWSSDDLAHAQQQLEKLDRRWQRIGDPSKHPWRGTGLTTCGLRERQRAGRSCEELSRALARAASASSRLAALLEHPASRRRYDAREQLDLADRVLAAPLVPAADLQDGRWDALSPELLDWLHAGRRRAERRECWGAQLKAEAESQDWQATADRRRCQADSIWRLLRPSWHADGKRLRAASLDGRLPPRSAQVQLLDALVESGRLRRQIEASAATFTPLFGPTWAGIDGDWTALTAYADGASAARMLINQGKISAATAGKWVGASDRASLASAANDSRDALAALEDAWREWLGAIASDEQQWLGGAAEDADWGALADRLAPLPGQLDSLPDWVDFRSAMLECSKGRLKPYVEIAMGRDGNRLAGRLAPAFTRHFFRLWAEGAMSGRPSLAAFRGQDHEALIARFRAADIAWIEQTRRRLSGELAAKRPAGASSAHRQSKLGLLQAEFRKKTRHLPLRKLLHEVGDLVQAMKPCFMMSPLSIAQYLSPGSIRFEVVVFDEASQVEEADAYGAVARAGQVVLVGDERQLPPTDFFARNDPQEGDESDDAPAVRVGDLESVLSAGIVHIPHRCSLRWHYRSRHSSLIEFSNHKFYEDQLRVFPSPHTDCSELGLAFQFVEGGTYLRGAGRYNPVEARAVASAVIRHALEHPERTLGVGTLNLPQRMAIEDEIERLRREQPNSRVESFFAAHPESPFFVKNLENIQGDERDVILLSVGFGKDANGRMSLNFGALNDDGGWRRLNVLITRARFRCVVFSSIRADDINLGGTQARGVVALKEYLYAAERGRFVDAPVPGGGHDSEFEAAVCNAIRERGWEVHTQVGCAGFAIDMAVVSPLSPGRYLLGIECDGATYHSSPTARDRDRLRQSVLENLGWTIYRIWSTDWFQHPSKVLDTLLQRLDQLNQESGARGREQDLPAGPAPAPPAAVEDRKPETQRAKPPAPAPVPAPSEADPQELPPGVIRYLHSRDDEPLGTAQTLLGLSPGRLAEHVRQLVRREGPIHHDEAARAVAERFEARLSARLRQGFDRAIATAVSRGWAVRRGEFLWPPEMEEPPIRARGDGCPVTKPELIAPEEFEAAVNRVLHQQFGLKFDAVVEAVARAFGFARTGAKLREAIQSALVRLDERGEIQLDDAQYVTPIRPDAP